MGRRGRCPRMLTHWRRGDYVSGVGRWHAPDSVAARADAGLCYGLCGDDSVHCCWKSGVSMAWRRRRLLWALAITRKGGGQCNVLFRQTEALMHNVVAGWVASLMSRRRGWSCLAGVRTGGDSMPADGLPMRVSWQRPGVL
ncbi:hypothetical protein OIU85_003542 [Salix viminalis]|uniref:Uncharacterized protein n=1 Tax=Salix viminalis TaxID=40686 RepID=A0A9Q0T0S0_SALVM|nr:hypothetical protein OIU85_003542 [Salix viminalis]